MNATQAGVLCDRLSAGTAPLAPYVRIALRVVCDMPAAFSNDDLGRALAQHASDDRWQADRTFESQGARYRELLIECGLIHESGELTEQGVAVLGRQASVWWVNQGATFAKERDGGFLWAPMLNKAGRPQYHWDTMDEVREGDIVLHYSNGSLRAVSRVSAAARPAPNPLGASMGRGGPAGRDAVSGAE